MEKKFPGFLQLPLTLYSKYCVTVFSSLGLGLQFLLSAYEFFFYVTCKDHREMVDILMKTTRKQENMITFMDNFQQCFAIFLLFDLSLMFLYWLIHLCNAYFTFQETSLAATGSVLIILAELWRVLLITDACENFTREADKVIMKLQEMKVTMTSSEERRVSQFSSHIDCQ